jgi:peptide/nickel transport system substrate-binding protein
MLLTNRVSEPSGAQRARARRSITGCIVVVAFAVAAVLAGCGSGGAGSKTTLNQDVAKSQKTTSAEVPQVTWGINVKGLTLNVLSAPTVPNVSLLANVAQGFLQYDAYGALKPELASQWKQVTPTVYTYAFKPGARFSDGKPVTVNDVVYSMQQEMNPKTGPITALFYLTVKSIEAQGNTVKVTLKSPDPTWKYTPGHYSGWVYEKAAMIRAGSNFGSAQGIPIGSGPYKITEFTTDHVTFVRNPYYTGPKPKVAKVVVRLITDDATRLAAMQSGDIDGTLYVPLTSTPEWAKLPSVNILSVASPNDVQAFFNLTKRPFNDVHARRAMMYAFNREAIVKDVLHGNGSVAYSLVSPDMWVNEQTPAQAQARSAEQGPQYPFDLAKAKAELAKSKYPHGFTTSVIYSPDDASVGLAMEVWAQSLKSVGINLKLHEVTSTDVYTRGAKGDYSLAVIAGSFDYPDPLNYMTSLCSCHPEFNFARYNDPTYDQLLNSSIAQPDQAKRVDGLMKALSLASTAVAEPVVWFENSVAAVNRKYALTDFGPWTWLRPWMADVGAAASSNR